MEPAQFEKDYDEGILFNASNGVAGWMHKHMNMAEDEHPLALYQAFGLVNPEKGEIADRANIADDDLVGGAYFFNHQPAWKDITMALVLCVPLQMVHPKTIVRFFHIPFSQYGVNHIRIEIEKTNTQYIRLAESFGFGWRGELPECGIDGQGIEIWGMTRDECPIFARAQAA